jgi:hypothetical protein
MDDDVRRDLEAATRALEAELGARDDARPMTHAELDELVDCGADLEQALRMAQEAEMPITEEAFAVWDRARQFVREHEPAQAYGLTMRSNAADEPNRS